MKAGTTRPILASAIALFAATAALALLPGGASARPIEGETTDYLIIKMDMAFVPSYALATPPR